MWADTVIDKAMIEDLNPPVSAMKHETFPIGREGQHTWTQSSRYVLQKGFMLVTTKEAQAYIKEHGALVKGQASWTATENKGKGNVQNWVSCGDQNAEGLGIDSRDIYKYKSGRPALLQWSEDLDYVDEEKG